MSADRKETAKRGRAGGLKHLRRLIEEKGIAACAPTCQGRHAQVAHTSSILPGSTQLRPLRKRRNSPHLAPLHPPCLQCPHLSPSSPPPARNTLTLHPLPLPHLQCPHLAPLFPLSPLQDAAKAARLRLRDLKARAQAERVEVARGILLQTGFPRKVVLQIAADDGAEGGSAPSSSASSSSSGGKFISPKKANAAPTAMLPAVLVYGGDGDGDGGVEGDPMAPAEWSAGGATNKWFVCLGADNRLMKASASFTPHSSIPTAGIIPVASLVLVLPIQWIKVLHSPHTHQSFILFL